MGDSAIRTRHLYIPNHGDTRRIYYAIHQRFCASWAKSGIGKKTPDY